MQMGANEGAEICERLGLYIPTEIHKNIDFTSIGLFQDDGLAEIRSALKYLFTIFLNNEMKITAMAGKTSTNFLDINF